MKNYLAISVAALFFAVGIAIVASSNAAAIDFIYCLAPDGSVRAQSTSYSSDCTGLVPPGSREISETRAKALFEEERRRALGLSTVAQSALAVECPKYFAAAQTGIDKVVVNMKADIPSKRMKDKALVQALLDDAISRLASARQNHETAQNDYDHARHIAKAGAALAYARAADVFHYQVLSM